jgi:hypothetical protein
LFFALVLALSQLFRDLGAEKRAIARPAGGEGARPMLCEAATQFESTVVRALNLRPRSVFAAMTAAELARHALVRIRRRTRASRLLEVGNPQRALLRFVRGPGGRGGARVERGVRGELLSALWLTVKSTLAALVLYLAWSLSAACGRLGTANYQSACSRSDRARGAALLDVALAAAIGFATRPRGALAILLPLVVALAYQFGERLPSAGTA